MSKSEQSDDMLSQSVIEGLSETMLLERRRRQAALVGGFSAIFALAGTLIVRHHTHPQFALAVVGAVLAGLAFAASKSAMRSLALTLAAWIVCATQLDPGPMLVAMGVHCALIEAFAFLLGTVPLALATVLNKDPPSASRLGALAFSASALAGAALHVACDASTNAPHFVVFHLAPSVVCAAVSVVAASRWRKSTLSA